MASFKITDLTELTGGSVADTDVLEIVDLDADQSKKVTIASLKTVFSASEGSSYTGGTSNGIMFNDGDTFATHGGLQYDDSSSLLSVGGSGLGDGKLGLFRSSSGGSEIGRLYVSNQYVFLREQTGNGGVLTTYDDQVALHWRRHGSSDVRVQINPSVSPSTFDATFQVNLRTDTIGQAIYLSNGQTADAFQINSFGNTGGDLFRVTSNGRMIFGSSANKVVISSNVTGINGFINMFYDNASGYGKLRGYYNNSSIMLGASASESTYIRLYGSTHATNADEMQITAPNGVTISNGLNLASLPTSSAGLSSGDLWNDSGTVKIV